MHIKTFLDHWHIRRDPFLDEEARNDEVFLRLIGDAVGHFELPKIMGDLDHPASAVVFGEKGSGKTAIRLQVEAAIARHNREHPDHQVLVVSYDDLNPILDRFARRVSKKNSLQTLQAVTLNDHIDAILGLAVPRLVDRALGPRAARGATDAVDDALLERRTFRHLDRGTRRDWLLLQALYDRPENAAARSRSVARRVRLRRMLGTRTRRGTALALWVLTAAAGIYLGFFGPIGPQWAWVAGLAALVVLTLLTTALVLVSWGRARDLAGALTRQLRVIDHNPAALATLLEQLPREVLDAPFLPVDDLDESRFEMLQRLRRAIAPFGYTSVVVLLDRVDEPTLVNGDAECMQAVVWPMLNNKFLQAPGFAVKMMLPLELRYAVQSESKSFFQSARLDKQNLIDRLQWTGATLYDLCNRRLRACLEDDAQPINLRELFDESTGRDDIVAALDQMRQPRDAFKLLHQIIQRHCATTTEEEQAWWIPRHVIDDVLERQKERLDALRSGLAPA